MFSDLLNLNVTRALQKNINMSAAQRILIGSVPMLNKETKAAVKDSIAISPDLLGKFLALVRSAISESVRVASAPLENMQGITFPSENDLFSSQIKTTLASSGINSNLIFSSDIKPNIVETKLSLDVDLDLVGALYQQFNTFMNIYANKVTKNFKFYFEFCGYNFFTDRAERMDKALKMASQGIVIPQLFSSALGMKPSTFRRHMEEARANGFVDNLTPILQAAQMSPDSGAGRPQKAENDLSDSGSDTRGSGANLEKEVQS